MVCEHLTWAEVDLAAIQNNLRQMKALTGVRVMAMVKANAYGHGLAAVARAAERAGADWLGVVSVAEGLALRSAGVAAPILVLGYTPPPLVAVALGGNLALTVFDWDVAQACSAAGRASGCPARLHVKVDTGMGRLGVAPAEVPAFVSAVGALAEVQVEGILTHFARADEADDTYTQRQLAQFEEVLQTLIARGQRPPLVHAANSAAAIALPSARYDLVRMGIALYGLAPSADVPCPPEFIPALSWKTIITQVKTLPPGSAISYGGEYVTTGFETLATVAVGYGDGFRRRPRGSHYTDEVLIHGRRAPVRGRICMDQMVVSVNDVPQARVGDEVVLIGRQGAAGISADEVAQRWGTINYEVTTGIAARVTRLYTGE